MKKVLSVIIFSIVISLSCSALAHPGSLDKNGGHKDNKNVSGLGSYHYHCDGHQAHLHGASGLCPYRSAYKEHKKNVEALKALYKKADGDLTSLSQEEYEQIQSLLINKYMPFKLSEELLSAPDTQFGITNVKGLNIRKKPSTKANKVSTINVTGTPLLIKAATDDGWYEIEVSMNNKSYEGFVQQKMIDIISIEDYFADLSDDIASMKEPY